ncbi:hypothetical protein ACJX0J_029792, partial [Zea mays]
IDFPTILEQITDFIFIFTMLAPCFAFFQYMWILDALRGMNCLTHIIVLSFLLLDLGIASINLAMKTIGLGGSISIGQITTRIISILSFSQCHAPTTYYDCLRAYTSLSLLMWVFVVASIISVIVVVASIIFLGYKRV